MKHPSACGCGHSRPPAPPPRPSPHDGVLLPRIAGCEKRVIPRLCTVLEAFGLPECAFPLRLERLLPSESFPTWTTGRTDGCGRAALCVSIPVRMVLRDRCGHLVSASSVVDVDTWIPCRFLDCWGCMLRIVPSLQLLCSECASCDPHFDVQLHVTLDFYLLRPEVMHHGKPAPACPQLPLYPPPIGL